MHITMSDAVGSYLSHTQQIRLPYMTKKDEGKTKKNEGKTGRLGKYNVLCKGQSTVLELPAVYIHSGGEKLYITVLVTQNYCYRRELQLILVCIRIMFHHTSHLWLLAVLLLEVYSLINHYNNTSQELLQKFYMQNFTCLTKYIHCNLQYNCTV